MIPEFPEFKKLELEDKDEIEGHTRKYPPYSDFEFASLYAWDVQEKTMISWLNENLVVRFTDYVTGDFFYTFIGDTEVNDTAKKLLDLSKQENMEPRLKLIPEVTAKLIDAKELNVVEDRDNFDYIFEVKRYITFSGNSLKSRRNSFNGFLKKNAHYKGTLLDLTDPTVIKETAQLRNKWSQDSTNFSTSEEQAFVRFVQKVNFFKYLAIGITISDTLVGLSINALAHGDCANSLFLKGDKEYKGIYAALMHENSKRLLEKGYRHVNYEQDLGIPGLRQAKKALDPSHFLKKYIVSL